MNRLLLALVAALGAAGPARADYVVIIANLNAPPGGAGKGMTGGTPMPGTPTPAIPATPVTGATAPAPANPDAIDDDKALVVAVLEVRPPALKSYVKLYEAGQPITFAHRLAPGGTGTIRLRTKDSQYEAILLRKENGGTMGTVRELFKRQADETYKDKDKANPEAVLKLAEKALDYGLVDEFAKAMDRLEELDKANATPSPKVAAYKKVKEALAKPAGKPDLGPWKAKLLDEYKVAQKEGSRFALVHNFASDEAPEVKTALARLDRAFKGFYYWLAFKETVLPLPPNRLVSVLTSEDTDFNNIKRQVSAGPVANDSFHAPREGLSVFSAKRSDEQYSHLSTVFGDYWKSGYHKSNILTGKTGIGGGLPRGSSPEAAHGPRLGALLLKALQEEWDKTAVTHKTARELVFASGLLPRNVHAPEWVQFGVGSFFESPLQSPWSGIGVPNSYWLPRFKDYDKAGIYGDMKGPGKRKAQLAALIKTVTDEGFRARPPANEAEASLRHARAAAWSLTYFLANLPTPKGETKPLLKYFAELSRQPRDIDLDKDVLLACFARAFNCWDKEANKPNMAQLEDRADRWFTYARNQKMEGDYIHEQIRKSYALIRKPPTTGTGPGTTPPIGTTTPP